MSQSYVIVGDGIARASAAGTLREEKSDADIAVIMNEGEPLYDCILIKEFAKGKLPETPISTYDKSWYDDRDVDLELDTLVTGIDPEGHTVTTHDGTGYDYDKFLLAVGGTPTQLPAENSDTEGVHCFWTFQDAHDIKEYIEGADNSVVIGADLLGVDLAAIITAQEAEGKYLMRGKAWWRCVLSEEGAEIIHEVFRKRNVGPVFDFGVDHFEVDDDDRITTAVDSNGNHYDVDLVGIVIGLNFSTKILGGTDIEYDNSIYTDKFTQTNHGGIFTAGDITEFHDLILGDRAQNGTWGSTKEQDTIAVKNMVDYGSEGFRWVSSYSVTYFDFPFLSFGHLMLGDGHVEAEYSDTEWRRLAIEDGKTVGGVLIGDLSPQTEYKKLMCERVDVSGQKGILVKQDFQLDDFRGTVAER